MEVEMKELDRRDILFEDSAILVVRKPSGIAVQHGGIGQMDLEHQLLNYLAESTGGGRDLPYLGMIHRLDQPVEGILVFARNRESAANLNRQMQQGKIIKEYLAVVEASGASEAAVLVDYLRKDSRSNTSSVVKPDVQGAKRSELSYCIRQRKKESGRALVSIRLKTGRHHQIRVQMSNAGMPLCGDAKYNTKVLPGEQLALCACFLSFLHPNTGKKLDFSIEPENPIFEEFARK